MMPDKPPCACTFCRACCHMCAECGYVATAKQLQAAWRLLEELDNAGFLPDPEVKRDG